MPNNNQNRENQGGRGGQGSRGAKAAKAARSRVAARAVARSSNPAIAHAKGLRCQAPRVK